jgi:hypothetical protein
VPSGRGVVNKIYLQRDSCLKRKLIAFCANVEQAVDLAEQFCNVGVRAECIIGTTPEEERDRVTLDNSFLLQTLPFSTKVAFISVKTGRGSIFNESRAYIFGQSRGKKMIINSLICFSPSIINCINLLIFILVEPKHTF